MIKSLLQAGNIAFLLVTLGTMLPQTEAVCPVGMLAEELGQLEYGRRLLICSQKV